MEKARIFEILRRLGFFYIKENTVGTHIEFLAGHMPETLFHVVTLNANDNHLSGSYASLLTRLDTALARYEREADDVIWSAPNARQAWIAELARIAQLSTEQLQHVVQNKNHE